MVMTTRLLHVDVHHEHDGCWAEAQSLPGCFASADAPAELIACAKEAVALYLSGAQTEISCAYLDLDLVEIQLLLT